ncbi:MAG: tetratricopeptide repeat protein [Cytophagaceae bacterium]|nr:tetratricopeptide repeat protein [Cytophagaceae bacterium]
MKTLLAILLLIITSSHAFSQTDKEKAHQLCLKGIEEMDKGEIENAIGFFEQASKLDPENFFYPYEIAHSHYLTHQYKKTIQLIEPLLQHKEVTDLGYHLLGSSYENSKNTDKAIQTYQAGLEKFPNSGILYGDLGNLFMKGRNYKEALSYFEKGIQAEPEYSENYYWASKLHSSMEDKLWGIVFAELYINMEGVTDKSHELGRMVYDVYQKGIVVSESGKVTVELADADTTHKNFEHDFERISQWAADSVRKPMTIATIYNVRKIFLTKWIENGDNNRYPNTLFDWHQQLYFRGYFEAYHYWLFKEGNPEEFEKWKSRNEELYNEFVTWIDLNFLMPSRENYFVPSQYN